MRQPIHDLGQGHVSMGLDVCFQNDFTVFWGSTRRYAVWLLVDDHSQLHFLIAFRLLSWKNNTRRLEYEDAPASLRTLRISIAACEVIKHGELCRLLCHWIFPAEKVRCIFSVSC